ncbi:HIR complex subunit [Oleoguttula sp. CCFEE 5521]
MAMPPGFGDKMLRDEAAELSSSSISSAPNSPHTIQVARPQFSNSATSGGGVVPASSATSAHTAAGHSYTYGIDLTGNSASQDTAVPVKVKRQRKKKEIGPDGKPIESDKPKQTRKPRAPKDPSAATNGNAPPRKKLKTEDKASADQPPQARQATLTEMNGGFHAPTPLPHNGVHSRQSLDMVDGAARLSNAHSTSASAPRPHSSGQNYDPVRSATIESAPPRPAQTPVGLSSAHASPHINRASASPSIASLIDPPFISKTSAPPTLSPSQSFQQTLLQSRTQAPTPTSAAQPPINAFAPPPLPIAVSPPMPSVKPAIAAYDGPMDIDEPVARPKPQQSSKTADAKKSKTSSSAATPQPPSKPTPPLVPKATGSGLLSSSNLFGGPASSTDSAVERRGVNIDIRIPLDPRGGNTINIASEIMKKYGRDAINPRAAAHRERLLQIEAAANKLDGESGDGSTADSSDEDIGSNVEMGGMDSEGQKPATRKKKTEEYDKEDDFIDDTELAWQEQAAVAKDGFFVYSGPLVPVGEIAKVESATATKTGRGRGRGRARGAAAAAAGTTHAAFAKEKESKEGVASGATTTTRGRARAARGTGATRKPRMTKADRERNELEKKDRERAAGLSGPSAAPPTAMSAMAAPPAYAVQTNGST